MSTRIMDAYMYDRSEKEMLLELNVIRDAYHEYLKSDIKKDPNKWMHWGRYFADNDKDVPDEHGLRRACRYIEKGLYTMERGNPLDVAGSCIVVKHRGKIVLWFFPGFNFSQFAKKNKILQRIRKNEYWWMDSADCEWDAPEEEKAFNRRGRFWQSVFDYYKTSVPSRMGLMYEFFSHEDVFRFGYLLDREYEKYLERSGK